jgi:ABC-type branched-subunit amino acid transport system substrate-binding protein
VLTRTTKRVTGVAVVAALTLASMLLVAPGASSAPSVRGFSNGTITVAGMGFAANFDPDATVGATARFKRFNDDGEIKGIKIDYKEFADDNQDPAKSQTEATRLVRQVGVFAIVPDRADTNPGAFLNSQHVPYFGWAFDDTYCSATPAEGAKLYGFGFNGCLVPANPKRMPGTGADQLYQYVTKKTGKTNPTVALFSTDTQAGRDSTGFQASAYAGAGFKVVYSKGEIPTPPVADYTPYVQKLMTADNGNPPDLMVCLLATQCINMYTPIHTGGYNGTFFSALYDPRLASVFDGALLLASFQPPQDPTPATEQMQKDVDAVKSGQQLTSGTVAGYLSADFFIQALAKASPNPTPEKVQAAASKMTYQEKGLIGPTKYPDSHVIPTPSCGAIVTSDGTNFSVVEPYTCSTKTYPVLKKYRA